MLFEYYARCHKEEMCVRVGHQTKKHRIFGCLPIFLMGHTISNLSCKTQSPQILPLPSQFCHFLWWIFGKKSTNFHSVYLVFFSIQFFFLQDKVTISIFWWFLFSLPNNCRYIINFALIFKWNYGKNYIFP